MFKIRTSLPYLTTVCFTGINLMLYAQILPAAFNTLNLKALSIQDCDGYLTFLTAVTSLEKKLELKRLELFYDTPYTGEEDSAGDGELKVSTEYIVADFIDLCPKLEDVYVEALLEGGSDPLSSCLRRRAGTLRRIIIHPLEVNEEEDIYDSGSRLELCPLGFTNDFPSLEAMGTCYWSHQHVRYYSRAVSEIFY